MNLNEWRDAVWTLMEAKGFHADRSNGRDDVMVRLALIHTEVSEAIQEVKRRWVGQGDPPTRAAVTEELADVLIRVFDLFGCLGEDVDAAVKHKMEKNAGRPLCYGTPRERPQ